MMIHAYQEIYLNKAQALLGEAFDYAVNTCGIHGETFTRMLIASSVCSGLENGEPAILAGRSGIEFAREVVKETTGKSLDEEPCEQMGRSIEYWIGWAIAYYQWWSGKKFSVIFKAITYDDLSKLYYTLHEADVTKFVEIVDARIQETFPQTKLRRIRDTYGCTQEELAKMSGVGLRSIQMYEQRNKDINKASVESVYSLAKALGCTVENLIE